jgi:hypothetical protein
MKTLMIGTPIRRLNHLEYPAFEKMNQNGMMIKTTRIRQMTSPYIGIISDMEFLLRMDASPRFHTCLSSECQSITYCVRSFKLWVLLAGKSALRDGVVSLAG